MVGFLYTLGKLQKCGSSIFLNWGEDTNGWEVSVVSSGRRFVFCASDLGDAIDGVCLSVFASRDQGHSGDMECVKEYGVVL